MAAVIAVPFGLIALRVRRHTFVVVTIAIFFIFQLMAANFSFTGGTSGLSAPFLAWNPATYNDPFYYLALAIVVGTIGLAWLIRGSRFGLQLRAIRDDEERARGLGVRTMRVKLAAFVISAFVTGMLGGLWFYFITQVLPQSGFDPLFDLSVALIAFFGGLGTVSGPVLGALILVPAQQYFTEQFTNDYLSQIVFGSLFLVVILLLPRGVIPTAGEKIASWRARWPGRRPGAARRSARHRWTPRRSTDRPVPPAAAAGTAGPGRSAMRRRPAARAEHVSKAFGGVQALSDCTVEVTRGSITGLIGPNGSGKTTLFNVITGYERVDAGDIYADDRKITNARPERAFALGIGRTFQLTRIFPRLTIMENMLVATQHRGRGRWHNPLARAGGPADRRRAMELLEFTGIAGHATALADTLSYGQRKLLELAYVLVADPEVVLLDEPAGGVNPSLIQHIAARIRELNARGTTFLIVEHNMDFVMGICDRVTVLDYGTVVASGPPEIIRSNPRVLDAYLGITEEDDDDPIP